MRSLTLPRVAPPLGQAWSVWWVMCAWWLQGTALLVAGVSTQAMAGSRGVLAGATVASELGQPLAIGLVALGLCSWLGCVLVVVAQRFAQPTLCVVGLVGALTCAFVAPVSAAVALGALVAAVFLGFATDALDHLHPVPTATARTAR